MTLPFTAAAARLARDAVQRHTGLTDDLLDDVLLVVSELVSNAVRYGRPEIALSVIVTTVTIDVRVHDHGASSPHRRESAVYEPSGRGLMLVEQIAANWGSRPDRYGVGKTVWALLAR